MQNLPAPSELVKPAPLDGGAVGVSGLAEAKSKLLSGLIRSGKLKLGPAGLFPQPEQRCQVCDESFVPYRRGRKTCSAKCAVSYRKQKANEYNRLRAGTNMERKRQRARARCVPAAIRNAPEVSVSALPEEKRAALLVRAVADDAARKGL